MHARESARERASERERERIGAEGRGEREKVRERERERRERERKRENLLTGKAVLGGGAKRVSSSISLIVVLRADAAVLSSPESRV